MAQKRLKPPFLTVFWLEMPKSISDRFSKIQQSIRDTTPGHHFPLYCIPAQDVNFHVSFISLGQRTRKLCEVKCLNAQFSSRIVSLSSIFPHYTKLACMQEANASLYRLSKIDSIAYPQSWSCIMTASGHRSKLASVIDTSVGRSIVERLRDLRIHDRFLADGICS